MKKDDFYVFSGITCQQDITITKPNIKHISQTPWNL